MKRFTAFLAAVFLTAGWGGLQKAHAHPHAWIDLHTELRFNERGQAVALAQRWLLDPAYSSFSTAGMDKDGDGSPDWEGLDALLRENMKNLKKYQYFTKVYDASGVVAFKEVVEMSTRMRGNRLEMQFELPFAAPVAVSDGKELTYRVFDPTYYIEVVHAEEKDAVSLSNAPDQCRAHLEPPNPNPEMVMLAASLDRTESGGDGLGKFFAETVRVKCSAAD